MEQAYTAYFEQQAGGGGGPIEQSIGPVYQASFNQQSGRGCCGISGRILTAVATPLVAKGVRAVTEEVANASFGLIQDIQRDPTLPAIGQAAVNRAVEMGRNLKRRARGTLVGRGRVKKGKQKGKKVASKRKPASKTKIKRKGKPPKKQTGGGAQRERTQQQDIFS